MYATLPFQSCTSGTLVDSGTLNPGCPYSCVEVAGENVCVSLRLSGCETSGLSIGAIVGIAIGGVVALVLIGVLIWYFTNKNKKANMPAAAGTELPEVAKGVPVAPAPAAAYPTMPPTGTPAGYYGAPAPIPGPGYPSAGYPGGPALPPASAYPSPGFPSSQPGYPGSAGSYGTPTGPGGYPAAAAAFPGPTGAGGYGAPMTAGSSPAGQKVMSYATAKQNYFGGPGELSFSKRGKLFGRKNDRSGLLSEVGN